MDCAAFLDELARNSAETDKEVAAKFVKLSAAQLNWKAPGVEWSIAQEFDHMLRANRPYVATIEKVMAVAGPPGEKFKPSFWGKVVFSAARPGPSFVPVPTPLVPSTEPFTPSVVKEYQSVQKEFDRLLTEAREKNLCARLASPLASFVRMRLGDAFRVTVAHNQRHVEKARRLLDDPAFPKR